MPPTPAKDTTAPLVIATKPSSEQVGININDFIEVTFNEAIANVDTNQVSIYPYDTNHSISKIRINLQPTPFLYDPNTKTLTIRPELNSLKAATKYRVVIRAVKDKVGNVMVGACEWDFGTAGLPNFGLGKRGICETSITVAKDPTAPNEPQKVRAVAGDSSVTVTWQAAISGTEVTYYKIEKSVNSGQSFELVVGNVPSSKLIYTDLTAQNGISHIYRVIAGSSNGLFSNSVNSNLVTPVAIQVAMTPSVPENVKAVAGDGVVTVSWAAPSTGDSVTYYRIEKSVDSAAYKLVQD